MKLAVTAQNSSMDSHVAQRFGRAYGFIIFDTDSSHDEFVLNDINMNASSGAGIQTAQKLANLKVDAVITGNCGPKAFLVLTAAGIKVATVNEGTVRQNIERFISGSLKPDSKPNVEPHWI